MKSELSRRKVLQFAGAAAVGGLLPAHLARAQSGTALVMISGFDHSLEQLPELNAIAGGHFEREGVNVESMTVRGTTVAIQQVVTGGAHFVRCGALDLMRVVAGHNLPLVSVGIDLHGGIFSIISLSSAPIRTPEDLRGKTVAVRSLGGGQENALNLLLAAANIPADEVRREVSTADAGNVEFLKLGRLDAFIVSTEWTLIVRATHGDDVHVLDINDYAPMPGGAIVANSEFVAANADRTRAFMRAMKASALEILHGDINAILDRAHGAFELAGNHDRAFELQVVGEFKKLMLLKGEANIMRNVPEGWRDTVAMAAGAGLVTIENPESLYTNDYVEG